MKLTTIYRVLATIMLAAALTFIFIFAAAGDACLEPVKKTPIVRKTVAEKVAMRRQTISDMVKECCSGYPNLRPALVEAVIFYESGYDPASTDPNDETVSGLMQVSARWHQDRADKLGVDLGTNYGNILVGCDYLSELISQCKDERYALMCYNGGPAYGAKRWKKGIVTEYAQKIFDRANESEGVI